MSNETLIDRANRLVIELIEQGPQWASSGEEYTRWKQDWRNLIRLVYEGDDADTRLEEFDAAARYTGPITWLGADNDFERDFHENQTQLVGHVNSLAEDMAIRERLLEATSEISEEANEVAGTGRLVPVLRIFIGHDGETSARRKLENFVSAIGAVAVIAEKEPRKGRSVADHVQSVMRSCDYGIVISTKEKAGIQDGEPAPRGNVINEIEKVINEFGARWMLMLEKGVQLPSNIQEFVRSGFVTQSMDDAFTDLVRELVGHGLLTVLAPRE